MSLCWDPLIVPLNIRGALAPEPYVGNVAAGCIGKADAVDEIGIAGVFETEIGIPRRAERLPSTREGSYCEEMLAISEICSKMWKVQHTICSTRGKLGQISWARVALAVMRFVYPASFWQVQTRSRSSQFFYRLCFESLSSRGSL